MARNFDILSCSVASQDVMKPEGTNYDVIARAVSSLHLLWLHTLVVTSLHAVWRHSMWVDVIARVVTSLHVVWSSFTWCDIIARGVTSLHVVWRHCTRCEVIARDLTSLHLMRRHCTWFDVILDYQIITKAKPHYRLRLSLTWTLSRIVLVRPAW